MNMVNHLPARVRALVRFLHAELTEARPGRLAHTLQLGALCLIVTFVSITLHVPLLAVSLIVLFYGVQPNAFFTKVVAIVFVVATILDVGCLFLVLKYAYGYPLLRILAASLILLAGMYLMRVNKLGLMFFAVALVAIYGQTIPDSLDFPEIAVRALMWSVAAGMYPVLLMVIVCCLLFPSRPVALLQQEMRRQLQDVSARMAQLSDPARRTGEPATAPERRIEIDALTMLRLHAFAVPDDARYRAARHYWQACIAAVAHLRMNLNRLCAESAPLSNAAAALMRRLQGEVDRLDESLARAEPYRSNWDITDSERTVAVEHRLEGVCSTLRDLGRFELSAPPHADKKDSLFVPDLASNPAYLRFALKVLLASLICYVFYHGAAWDGIHTSMLTCVIVACPGMGASFQKMALRVGGALIGALLAVFVAIFVMPHLDGITGLLLTLAPIFFAGAWVATGSERSSYIGTQFVFTFALAMLEDHFGPVSDLTEVRDRAIGILIGIVVSSIVYTLVWPESETGTLRQKLREALRSVGGVFRKDETAGGSAHLAYLQQCLTCWEAFDDCEEMRERVALEVDRQSPARTALLAHTEATLAGCRRIVAQWDALRTQATTLDDGAAGALDSSPWRDWRARTATALERYADGTPAPCATAAVDTPAQRRIARLIDDLPDWPVPPSRDMAGAQPEQTS
ncbi:multidrug transporter subunit MdtO [Burkholderia sp. THE68]|uniref:FUSC family protein n=1 Tax=Burkholderia sp. THE68 TaxID=758782 RepID=UPI0013185303|nr:FUSC family protein [Burkholderia sp. THE68]BBU29652.1 multidrug transporter subunit MdtO [Burkholderia sp. THE68]